MIEPLFQPIQINRMQVKNRIFMPAMVFDAIHQGFIAGREIG